MFLSWFRAYRELEARATALADRADFLASENVRLAARLDTLTDKLAAAQRSEIDSLQKVADANARRHGGPIFDLASAIPVKPNFEPIPKERVQATSRIEEMERQFNADVAAMYAPPTGPATKTQ